MMARILRDLERRNVMQDEGIQRLIASKVTLKEIIDAGADLGEFAKLLSKVVNELSFQYVTTEAVTNALRSLVNKHTVSDWDKPHGKCSKCGSRLNEHLVSVAWDK